MKIFLIFLLTLTVALAQNDDKKTNDRAARVINKWLKKYNIQVKNDGDFEKFKQNVLKKFEEHSAHNEKYRKGEELFEKGLNHFSHMTKEERKAILLGLEKPTLNGDALDVVSGDAIKNLPDYFNWADQGVIHPPTNQKCRDCYIHGTTATIEAHACIFNENCEKLSEQEFLDCIPDACAGGWDDWVYSNDQKIGGATFGNYSYVGTPSGKCDSQSRPRAPGTTVTGWKRLPNDVDTIRFYLVNAGPMAVNIFMPDSLQDYKGGIFTSTDPPTAGHIICLVGYGSEVKNGKEVPYWILRNSWGENFGEKGYFRVIRGVDLMSIESSKVTYPALK